MAVAARKLKATPQTLLRCLTATLANPKTLAAQVEEELQQRISGGRAFVSFLSQR
jgi:hypothetical protein